MAARNAAGEQDGSSSEWIEEDPDMGKVLAEAIVRGEVWFLLSPVAWVVLGLVFLTAAGAVFIIGRVTGRVKVVHLGAG